MKNETDQKTEIERAREAGFPLLFKVMNGRICSLSYPERVYAVCQVVTSIVHCAISGHSIYHVETPDGTKGIAIVNP